MAPMCTPPLGGVRVAAAIGGSLCLICNRDLSIVTSSSSSSSSSSSCSPEPIHSLSDCSPGTSTTLRARLEKVLEDTDLSLASITPQTVCNPCYHRVLQIEAYYEAVAVFRKEFYHNATMRGDKHLHHSHSLKGHHHDHHQANITHLFDEDDSVNIFQALQGIKVESAVSPPPKTKVGTSSGNVLEESYFNSGQASTETCTSLDSIGESPIDVLSPKSNLTLSENDINEIKSLWDDSESAKVSLNSHQIEGVVAELENTNYDISGGPLKHELLPSPQKSKEKVPERSKPPESRPNRRTDIQAKDLSTTKKSKTINSSAFDRKIKRDGKRQLVVSLERCDFLRVGTNSCPLKRTTKTTPRETSAVKVRLKEEDCDSQTKGDDANINSEGSDSNWHQRADHSSPVGSDFVGSDSGAHDTESESDYSPDFASDNDDNGDTDEQDKDQSYEQTDSNESRKQNLKRKRNRKRKRSEIVGAFVQPEEGQTEIRDVFLPPLESAKSVLGENGERFYLCHLCDRRSKRQSILNVHILEHMARKPIPSKWTCVACNTQYNTEEAWEVHVRKHLVYMKYFCTSCTESFGNNHTLRIHERTHHGEVSFSYTLRHHKDRPCLKLGLNIHPDSSIYGCPKCEVTFASRKAIDLHIFSHEAGKRETGEMECNCCGDVFENQNLWSEHMTEHLKSMKKVCHECGKSCTKLQVLSTHHRKAHGRISSFFTYNQKGYVTPRVIPKEEVSPKDDISSPNTVPPQEDDEGMTEQKPEPELVFVCPICGKVFKNQVSMEQHVLEHNTFQQGNDNKFECTVCYHTFTESTRLKRHMKTHEHLESVFQCTQCNRYYGRIYELRTHEKKVHNRLASTFKAVPQNGGPIQTVTRGEGVPVQSCSICHKLFFDSCSLEQHKKEHFGLSALTCYACQITYETKEEFSTHVKTQHDNVYTYQCHECALSFKSLTEFNKHRVSHSAVAPVHCPVCGERFENRVLLQMHKTSMNHDHSGSNICPICGKTFKGKDYILRHLDSVHPTDGPHSITCDKCGKGFRYQVALKTHMKTHEEHAYTCEVCKKVFSQNASLRRHMLIHNNEKPLQCPHCPKSFRHVTSLKCHVAHHTGEFNHRCEICGKGFFRAIDLNRHASVHEK